MTTNGISFCVLRFVILISSYVILSPSCVILNEVKNLFVCLRINSAKNLIVHLRTGSAKDLVLQLRKGFEQNLRSFTSFRMTNPISSHLNRSNQDSGTR